MTYLTQMAGLAFHNFVSAATGIALAVALVRGSRAPQRAAPGQLLGRPDPLCSLPPAAHLRCGRARAGFAGGHPELQPLHRRPHAERRDAD